MPESKKIDLLKYPEEIYQQFRERVINGYECMLEEQINN